MGNFQVKTANNKRLYFGSGSVYIADRVSDPSQAVWLPLGVLTALSDTLTTEMATPDAINYQHDDIITNESATVALALQELVPETIQKCLGNTSTIEIITGAPVVGYIQSIPIGAVKGKFVKFSEQNYAGGSLTVPTAIVVTKDPGGTPVVLNTDYIIGRNEFGQFGITPTNTGAWDETKAHRIVYDYTPIAKTIINRGGATKIDTCMIKIVNEQSDKRTIAVTYWRCSFSEGGNMTTKKDATAEIIDFNITFKAKRDLNKPEKYQLSQTEFYTAI